MSESFENRDALSAAILTCIGKWRDRPGEADLHAADCEQLLSEYSAEESFRILELGNSAADAIERVPESAEDITLRLAGSPVEAARAVGCVLIARVGKFNPRTWLPLIRHLADDESAGVRDALPMIFDQRPELAGWSEMHTDYVFSIFEEWRTDNNYRIRRIVARGLVGFASQSAGNADRVLKLIVPLYEDASEFVRRNVVSAIREIGKSQPDTVFSFLESRIDAGSPYDRELIPMILEASFARKQPEWRDEILAKL
ncbi:DNA alkylation repair protein [bacterium]|nr:DNA alkylation repair protein [bacterium]